MATNRRTIKAFEIPVEVFCFFLVNNQSCYTVTDVRNYLRINFVQEINENRMREILKTFVDAGKLNVLYKATLKTKNNNVPHYSFKSII